MRKKKLSKKERKIETDLIEGAYQPVSKQEFDRVVEALQRRKKDAVLNIRVNQADLESIKRKAKQKGVSYQTLISEFLHHLAA